ncbi:MAG TPA: cytochrome c biogenesis protein CcsA [archaeon]|nr:cytochrome c biogenesis protein CcsA [archaeon]
MISVIRVFYIIALVLYSISAIAYIRDFSKRAPRDLRKRRVVFINYGALFQLISLVMYSIYLRQAPFLGMFQGFTFASFVLAALFLMIFRAAESEVSGGLIVVPLICLFAFVGIFTPLDQVNNPLLSTSPWFILHATAGLFSYGAFAIAFAAAILYLLLHREIKSKRLGRVFDRLPSLGELDHLTYLSVTIGFIALTVSIAFGMAWTQIRLGKLLQLDTKEIITFVNWLIFAMYLHSRISGTWRGKKSAWLVIVGFSVLLFNFFFVTVVLSRTHSFL